MTVYWQVCWNRNGRLVRKATADILVTGDNDLSSDTITLAEEYIKSISTRIDKRVRSICTKKKE